MSCHLIVRDDLLDRFHVNFLFVTAAFWHGLLLNTFVAPIGLQDFFYSCKLVPGILYEVSILHKQLDWSLTILVFDAERFEAILLLQLDTAINYNIRFQNPMTCRFERLVELALLMDILYLIRCLLLQLFVRQTNAEATACLVVLDVRIHAGVYRFKLRPRSTTFNGFFSKVTFQFLQWNPNLFTFVLAEVRFWSALFPHYRVVSMLLLYAWNLIMGFENGSEPSAALFDKIWLTVSSALDWQTVWSISASLIDDIITPETQLSLFGSFTVNCMALEHCEVQRLYNLLIRAGAYTTLSSQKLRAWLLL